MNDDESIPVLTEVVQETAPAPASAPGQAEAAAEAPTAAGLDDDAWRALEERLVARVLDRLQDRIALVLEDQVRTSMAPVLDHVVARLALELHEGLRQTVEQVVERAVAQELSHLKSRS
ncbi:hypothetical protein QPK32_24520 [Massilia sp. YIM B02763]|uniref:hypothetical protein n=1 Tax=Massilia sp. YIM B02763 TaxID=3050130 RepID=UPI0025B68C46|nr:hypothetical protein [Massilia sp. YIM B02763]MDN4056235.1 hypothetical protein [Massilia sp. YIM B02763]